MQIVHNRRRTAGTDYTWTVYDRRCTDGALADVIEQTRSEDYNHLKTIPSYIHFRNSYFKKQKPDFRRVGIHHEEMSAAAVLSSVCRLRVHFQPWMLPTRPGTSDGWAGFLDWSVANTDPSRSEHLKIFTFMLCA